MLLSSCNVWQHTRDSFHVVFKRIPTWCAANMWVPLFTFACQTGALFSECCNALCLARLFQTCQFGMLLKPILADSKAGTREEASEGKLGIRQANQVGSHVCPARAGTREGSWLIPPRAHLKRVYSRGPPVCNQDSASRWCHSHAVLVWESSMGH